MEVEEHDSAANFNPRSPHGERPSQTVQNGKRLYFNPRSPHGERQSLYLLLSCAFFISTHAPRTGSDKAGDLMTRKRYIISTHAPRTGSDSAKQQFCRPESEALHKKYTIKQSF